LNANNYDVNDDFERIHYDLTDDVGEEYETLFNEPQQVPVALDDKHRTGEKSKQSESEKAV